MIVRDKQTVFSLALSLLLCLAFVQASTAGVPPKPESSRDRLETTPDLMQSLPAANLPGNGDTFCGPVAVSNAMIWLSRNGFPSLAPAHCESPRAQGQLAITLAKYMKTNTKRGTSATRLLDGTAKYVRDKGCTIDSARYEGFELHPRVYSAEAVAPDIDWIRQGLEGKSAVLLLIGWYKYSPGKDEYRLYAQHWVTLVGYGRDRAGKLNPSIFIVHDSSDRSGPAVSHDYVKLKRIEHGSFSREAGTTKPDAKGWYKLAGDLKIKKGADCGILDGAVVLRLKVPSKSQHWQAPQRTDKQS